MRETWYDNEQISENRDAIFYRADGEFSDHFPEDHMEGRWRPSIFMYRWASRIDLEITGVRVERLNQITEEDAQAEGVEKDNVNPFEDTSYLGGFMNIWHKINGKRAPWESNCWVWVVEFKRTTGVSDA